MSLNLGDITVNEFEYLSDEELILSSVNVELDLMDLIHTLDNLENAQIIQEKALATESIECRQFAEELLGCSLEVQLPDADKIKGKKSFSEQVGIAIAHIKAIAPKIEKQAALFHKNIEGRENEKFAKLMKDAKASSNVQARAINRLTEVLAGTIGAATIFGSKTDLNSRATTLGQLDQKISKAAATAKRAAHEVDVAAAKGDTIQYKKGSKQNIEKYALFMRFSRSLLAALINANRYLARNR